MAANGFPMLRHANADDLPRVVAIYNASIPGRLATADLSPVSVEDRRAWFDAHDATRRPLWILGDDPDTWAWVSIRDFYEGRPAYARTAEISIYVAPEFHGRGVGRHVLHEALRQTPGLGIDCLLASVFDHNEPSLRLYEGAGFARWGHLREIAELDGVRRGLVILGRRLSVNEGS